MMPVSSSAKASMAWTRKRKTRSIIVVEPFPSLIQATRGAGLPKDSRRARKAEVGILGDHDIVVIARETQDGGIIGLAQTDMMNVGRVWKEIGESADERRAEILVEEQFHAGWEPRSRSRSAA